jgi:hypothetical protein
MALTKIYNYKGIELLDAYFTIADVNTSYMFRKSFTDDKGNGKDIKGRALVDIAVYENEQKYIANPGKPLEIIKDIPLEGENFIYDQTIRQTITGALSYKKDNKTIDFDVNDYRYPVYTKLKQLKPKNAQLDFSDAKDC